MVKLKKINAICIASLSLLALGSATLSTYFMYKVWKYQKKLEDLEHILDNLKFNITEDDHELEFIPIRENFDQDSSDESTGYDTPVGTPPLPESQYLTRLEESLQVSFEDPLNDDGDDNKCLERLKSESYENLREISTKNRLAHQNDPTNIALAIDYIRTLYVLAEKEPEPKTKRNLDLTSYHLAKECLIADSCSYLSQKWFTVTTGQIVEYSSINDKVKLGFQFKEHIDMAIELNSRDHMLFYLRGRWSFKMCNLSWAEKQACRFVFGRVPECVLDDALKDFVKAQELNVSQSKGNLLYLAKVCISSWALCNNKRPTRPTNS
jgi:hypothetical protein